jgi:hypothetical protein
MSLGENRGQGGTDPNSQQQDQMNVPPAAVSPCISLLSLNFAITPN